MSYSWSSNYGPAKQGQDKPQGVPEIVLDILMTVNESEKLRKMNAYLPGLIEYIDASLPPSLRVFFNNKLRELWKSKFPNVPYPEVKVTPEDSLLKIYSELRKIVTKTDYMKKIVSEVADFYIVGVKEAETMALNELNKLLFDTVVYWLRKMGVV